MQFLRFYVQMTPDAVRRLDAECDRQSQANQTPISRGAVLSQRCMELPPAPPETAAVLEARRRVRAKRIPTPKQSQARMARNLSQGAAD